MLQLARITKRFDGKLALDQVSLTVRRGQTHALIGSSGSGKSTLLRILLGVLPADAGRVILDGDATDHASRLGYVPQAGGLFPHLTAHGNVTLVAGLRGWSRSRIADRVRELCRTVDLDVALLARYPAELSGGQNQRVALVRAAFLDPDILLLDEPMGALDPLIRHELQIQLRDIFRRLGKTVILVTHDLSEAAYLADEVTLLHEGRVVQSGTLRELVEHPVDPFVTRFIRAQRPPMTEGSAP